MVQHPLTRREGRAEVAFWLLGALDAALAACDWRVADGIVRAIEVLARERGCARYRAKAYSRMTAFAHPRSRARG
jgi:hypothetical protein